MDSLLKYMWWSWQADTLCTKFSRAREEQLAQEKSEEMSDLRADHMRDKQEMLGEFNQAQEILKDKISSLQIL